MERLEISRLNYYPCSLTKVTSMSRFKVNVNLHFQETTAINVEHRSIHATPSPKKNEFYFVSIFFLINFLFDRSYPTCSGVTAPGLAADMHFRDDVVAFVGPACMFALEPVARLAAYWNTPIITGMGDQVRKQMKKRCNFVVNFLLVVVVLAAIRRTIKIHFWYIESYTKMEQKRIVRKYFI